jgi:hypothetical protein
MTHFVLRLLLALAACAALMLAGCPAPTTEGGKQNRDTVSKEDKKEEITPKRPSPQNEKKPDQPSPADNPKQEKEPSIKCVTDQLEKAWGVRFKSMQVEGSGSHRYVTITLEFSKDADPKIMREVFKKYSPTVSYDDVPVLWILFDVDNVALNKYVIVDVKGDPSGVKGDAFRLSFSCDVDSLSKAKKFEARLNEKYKAKEK